MVFNKQFAKHLSYILFILILCSYRLNAEYIHILFTANINGNLENCNCGKNSSGGIGRVNSFFSDFRNENKNAIIVDGGDYFNPYSFYILNAIMLQALDIMNYDVMFPGDQEFVEGSELYHQYLKKVEKKIPISNLNETSDSELRFSFQTFDIYFYGYLSNDAFYFIKKPGEVSSLPFSKIKPETGKNSLQVVILHGSLTEAKKISENSTWIDLILLGHDQYSGIYQTGQTLIVGGGYDSETVSIIRVKKSEKEYNKNINSHTNNDTEIECRLLNEFQQFDTKEWNFIIWHKNIEKSITEDKNIGKLINKYHTLIKNK